MAPGSPTAGRFDARTPTLMVLTALLAVLLFYSSMQPEEQSRSNNIQLRLNLETSAGTATLEAAGSQEQLEAAVAAAGSGGSVAAFLGQEADSNIAAEQLQDDDWEDEQFKDGEQSADAKQPAADRQPATAAAALGKKGVAADAAAAAQQPKKSAAQQAKEDAQRFLDYTKNAEACRTLDCLKEVADKGPGPGQFRFPHFYLIGFQKCATTSLFHHLADHPHIQEPSNKEPEFFTKTCEYNAVRCHRMKQYQYIRDTLMVKQAARANFTKAAFEGSTHYALEGAWLAPQMIERFPWIKVIVSMRDPISQAISMMQHSLEHHRVPACFDGELIFPCINADLEQESRYALSLRPWLNWFPRDQLHFIQYENITGLAMAHSLRDVKNFLGIDPKLPSDDLGLFNFRHQRRHTDGWQMTRSNYIELVKKARRNAEEVVEIVRQYNFADADEWLENWEAAWQKNLDEYCEESMEGKCMIHVT